jgi:RimJ/RimL family protein N-acetyltransferase
MTGLAMRRAEPTDAQFIVDLHRLPHVRDLLDAPTFELVQRSLTASRDETHIVVKGDEAAGMIVFAELAPWLFEIRRMIAARPGVGVGSFALAWTLDRIFVQRPAHRAYLEVHARNHGARRLYERCGFLYEGTYRDGARNPTSGAFEDLCIYGMLADEYRAKAPGL